MSGAVEGNTDTHVRGEERLDGDVDDAFEGAPATTAGELQQAPLPDKRSRHECVVLPELSYCF